MVCIRPILRITSCTLPTPETLGTLTTSLLFGVGLVDDFAFRRGASLVRIYPYFVLSRSYDLNARRDDARFMRMKILADLATTCITPDLDQN